MFSVKKELAGLAICLLILTGCTSGQADNATLPPPTPSFSPKAEIEELFAQFTSNNYPTNEEIDLRLGDKYRSELIAGAQQYCTYTEECKTDFVWLGPVSGYRYNSFLTALIKDQITIGTIARLTAGNGGQCPKDQWAIGTDTHISKQKIVDKDNQQIDILCVESLIESNK